MVSFSYYDVVCVFFIVSGLFLNYLWQTQSWITFGSRDTLMVPISDHVSLESITSSNSNASKHLLFNNTLQFDMLVEQVTRQSACKFTSLGYDIALYWYYWKYISNTWWHCKYVMATRENMFHI